jgi:hypothetical protein
VSLNSRKESEFETISRSYNKTVVEFEDYEIEFDEVGNIRFSTSRSDLNQQVIHEEYERAISIISDIFKKPERQYRVSLVFAASDFAMQSIELRDEVFEFGEDRFGQRNPEYTELCENSVKVSFGAGNAAVVL